MYYLILIILKILAGVLLYNLIPYGIQQIYSIYLYNDQMRIPITTEINYQFANAQDPQHPHEVSIEMPQQWYAGAAQPISYELVSHTGSPQSQLEITVAMSPTIVSTFASFALTQTNVTHIQEIHVPQIFIPPQTFIEIYPVISDGMNSAQGQPQEATVIGYTFWVIPWAQIIGWVLLMAASLIILGYFILFIW